MGGGYREEEARFIFLASSVVAYFAICDFFRVRAEVIVLVDSVDDIVLMFSRRLDGPWMPA